MERRCTYIQVVTLFAQAKSNAKIDSNTDRGRNEHNQRLHRLGMLETLNGLPDKNERNDNQRHSVDQRCQDAHSMVAKGLMRIRWSFCLCNSKPGQPKRKDI